MFQQQWCIYTHLERVGQIVQRHQPLSFFLVFWLVLLGFFQLEHCQKESDSKGKKSKAKVSVVAESWEGKAISKEFFLITSWILRGKNIFKRKVYLTTSWKQDCWRSCLWKPWHSSNHQQSIFSVSLVNKSAQLSVLVYLIKRLIVHNKKKYH